MNIYIDNKDLNIVKIKAFGNMEQPANTIEVEANSKYDHLFDIMKRMIKRGNTTYVYRRTNTRKFKRVVISVNDPLFEEYRGQYLVYYKDSGLVAWNPIKPYIELTTDAVDTLLPFNGIPDVKADGESTCRIWVKKYNSVGILLQRAKDNDIIEFDTTLGALSADAKKLQIGECYVDLTASKEIENRQVQVTARMGDIEGKLILQFAPASLYE